MVKEFYDLDPGSKNKYTFPTFAILFILFLLLLFILILLIVLATNANKNCPKFYACNNATDAATFVQNLITLSGSKDWNLTVYIFDTISLRRRSGVVVSPRQKNDDGASEISKLTSATTTTVQYPQKEKNEPGFLERGASFFMDFWRKFILTLENIF
uniref:Uncharacterized protein n=1 Tax=Romanomermis culicivorax TaxID=13658 RepID=A0A915J1S2_ROMCU